MVLILGVGSSLGVADAQTATGRDNPADAEVRTQRTANLSGADQLREGGHVIEIVSGMRRRVSDLLDRSRQERDIIKVNCLNDKLTQLDVTLRSTREHQDLLQTAVSINNDGQRNHEFTLLTIFRSHAQGLEVEAGRCIGEETGIFEHGPSVTVTINPNIPEVDTTLVNTEVPAPERPLVPSGIM